MGIALLADCRCGKMHINTLSISRERLKLETRRLACRWTPRGINEKHDGCHEGSHDPILEFWDPSISRERCRLLVTRTSQITVAQGWNPVEHRTTKQWLRTAPDQLQCSVIYQRQKTATNAVQCHVFSVSTLYPFVAGCKAYFDILNRLRRDSRV